MASPLISILVLTYNGEKYLSKQLESIIAQTWDNLEIVVCDDSSTDSTPAIIEKYIKKDGRIRPVFQKKNLGLNKNLEHALGCASGRFIAISDQDDEWMPHKIETLINSLGDNDAVYSDSILIDSTGLELGMTLLEKIGVSVPMQGRDPLRMLTKNHVSGHSVLFSANLISDLTPFNPEFMYDHQLGLLAMVKKGLAFHDKPLVLHRIHGENLVNNIVLGKTGKKKPSKAQRLEKRMKRREDLSAILQYVIEKEGEDRMDQQEQLNEIVRRLRRHEMFLDPVLFTGLLKFRKRIFHQNDDPIAKCFRFIKGRKFYALGL